MLTVNVKTQRGNGRHVSVLKIESVLQSPKVGDFIICTVCGEREKVIEVDVPARIEIEEDIPPAQDQKSMLEE